MKFTSTSRRQKIIIVVFLILVLGVGVLIAFLQTLDPGTLIHGSVNQHSPIVKNLSQFYIRRIHGVPGSYKTNFGQPALQIYGAIHSSVPEASDDVFKMMDHFIDQGANVNEASSDKMGLTLIHQALLYNDMALLKYLLRKGADVNATATGKKFLGMTPLRFSQELKNQQDPKFLEMIKLLEDKGAKL